MGNIVKKEESVKRLLLLKYLIDSFIYESYTIYSFLGHTENGQQIYLWVK